MSNLNPQSYRKTKIKEIPIVNLVSDQEGGEVDDSSKPRVSIKQESVERMIAESSTIKEKEKVSVVAPISEPEDNEIVVDHDESSNSYEYSYQYEPKGDDIPLDQIKEISQESKNEPKMRIIQEQKSVEELQQEKRKEKSLLLRLKIAEKLAAKRKIAL